MLPLIIVYECKMQRQQPPGQRPIPNEDAELSKTGHTLPRRRVHLSRPRSRGACRNGSPANQKRSAFFVAPSNRSTRSAFSPLTQRFHFDKSSFDWANFHLGIFLCPDECISLQPFYWVHLVALDKDVSLLQEFL